MSSTAHIINHTHWDREWFLTSIYTSRWIPGLIDSLERLVVDNPSYTFLLDGQTLVVEDLQKVAPKYIEKVERLVKNGNLIIGPYYCQPDWQLTPGELLIRNLMYGHQDMQKYGGGRAEAGWLVDTFGHISQAPQLHLMFGIEFVYVWRGVPDFEPYFYWQGPDGSRLFSIYLLGGYRNLYGVSYVPEVSGKRLATEMEKLLPYYPSPDVPLFDGYDLEDNPEDPISFFVDRADIPENIQLQPATPASFARLIREKNLPFSVIVSELNNGKYGATFPGTLSTRDYLKVMANDCTSMLLHLCEPLAVLARFHGREYQADWYEAWGRLLLQNAVHDGICGVSIDQVHEKMEYSYKKAFEDMLVDTQASLESIVAHFSPGFYAVSTNPFEAETWLSSGDRLYHSKTEGIGIWPVEVYPADQPDNPQVNAVHWKNDHYLAVVQQDGLVCIGQAILGKFIVHRENGDTYSDEPGEYLGALEIVSPLTIQHQSAHHCSLSYNARWQRKDDWVSVVVSIQFDPSPLVQWQVELDSRGTDLRVEMVFETNLRGERYAGMPFDLVQRQAADRDLFSRQAPSQYTRILLGQREVGEVSVFPFQDMLTICDSVKETSIFAKGVHAYTADEEGTVKLILRRSVEWLTKSLLQHRVGDAGPGFYVPDARCERKVTHSVAAAVGRKTGHPVDLLTRNAVFQNPPLIVQNQGYKSEIDIVRHNSQETFWKFFQEDLPLSSLQFINGRVLARFFNPTEQEHTFKQSYARAGVWGEAGEPISTINPKQIVTVKLEQILPEINEDRANVELINPPLWRVGENAGRPDPKILASLEEKIRDLEKQVEELDSHLINDQWEQKLRLEHQSSILKRECMEYRLSVLLNSRKLAQQGHLGWDYLYQVDEEIAALGIELNRLRIKRRIFDYIVQVL